MLSLFKAEPHPQPLIDTQYTPDWPSLFSELASNAKDPRLVKFYQAGAVAKDTPLAEVPFVSVDFETTGLNSAEDRILSVGLVPFTLARIQCNGSAHWVVNPNRPLNEESVVIHGITDSDVEHAPRLNAIIGPLLEALAGKIVVVHYKNIERQFLDTAMQYLIGEGIQFPVVDTLDIEYALQRRQTSGWWSRLRGKKPESVRLGKCRERYGLPAYQPHHALTDALATAELLIAQLAHHYPDDATIGDLWQ
uniref:3'-5' exonuclease n=1 Tax=Thaumasiovibrio occultus TaxID=1891184 RepID=UPI000B34F825|nr:3'-5' exonuclease [Thaumasiovibrio occultus]